MKSVKFVNYLDTSVENYIEMYHNKDFYDYYTKQSSNIINYFNFSVIKDDEVSTMKISYNFKYNFPKIVKKFLKLDSYIINDVCHTNIKEKTSILTNNTILHKIFKSKLQIHYKYEPISENSTKLISTYYYSCNLKIIGIILNNIFKNTIKKEHKQTINIWNDYIKIKNDF